MKKCTSCKENRPTSEFHKNPLTKDGLGSQCKTCDAAGRLHKSRAKKEKLVLALGGECSRCGYNKCLSALHFHHSNKDKEAGVSDLLKRHYETALREAEKCELVCANCHAEIHHSLTKVPEYGDKVRGGPIQHGTVAGYKRCKPSCKECKEAWSTYMSDLRKGTKTN